MKRKTVLVLSSLIALLFNAAQAERLFILYEPGCMAKLEYTGAAGGNTVYTITLSAGEKLILDIGAEAGKDYQEQLPTPLYGCANGLFSQDLVKRINDRKDEVFVVFRKNNRVFTVSPVKSAGFLLFNDQVIDFQSPAYQFRFDRVSGVIGENINTNKTSSAEITFEGIMNRDCMEEYIFRQIAPRSSTPYTDLTLIPQIGVVEERKGLTYDQAANNAMRLTNVDGKKVDHYIASLCKKPESGSQAGVTLSPEGYEVGTVYKEPSALTPKTPVEAAAGQAGLHTVAKGETLYGLSKKYKVSVKDLQTWNGLGNSTTIRAGSALKVSPTAGTAAAQPATAAKTTTLTTKTGQTFIPATTGLAEKPPVKYPIPYEETDKRIEGLYSKSGAAQATYYTVRAGDTPASLALKFGYTEARFRSFNGLTPTQVLKVGQQVKTTDCECPATPATGSTVTTTLEDRPTEFSLETAPVRVYSQTPNTQVSAYDNVETPTYQRPTYGGETPVPAAPGTYPAPTPNYNLKYAEQVNNNPTAYDASASTSGIRPMAPISYDNTGTLQARSGTGYQTSNYAEDFEPAGKRNMYIVQDGETLFSIARKNAITVDRLRQLNAMDANEILIPGQRIYLN